MLRSLFISLSADRVIRSLAESSSLGRRASRRFVAGMTVAEALDAAAELNRQGMSVSLDALGESVTRPDEAWASAGVYHQLLDEIQRHGLRANVSLKLTQMGLDVDAELAEGILRGLLVHAAETDNFVRVDMEGSRYTEATLAMVERLHGLWPGRVGTVLQAYLYRTAEDARRLVEQGIRVRLCKGAYAEPAEIAFPEKADVDLNFKNLMVYLATSPVFCGLATHDEEIIDRMCAFVASHGLAKDRFEFQMLYGIRRDLQRRLVAAGYGVRVYLPFGPAWYPYFMRRLAERPANLLFLAKNLVR